MSPSGSRFLRLPLESRRSFERLVFVTFLLKYQVYRTYSLYYYELYFALFSIYLNYRFSLNG